jgi:hypothetical protein
MAVCQGITALCAIIVAWMVAGGGYIQVEERSGSVFVSNSYRDPIPVKVHGGSVMIENR